MVIQLLLLFNLKQLKPEAKQAIDEVAKAKKDLIDQTPNATKEEKDAAKSKVDEEVTKEKEMIKLLQIVMLIRSKIKVQMALIVL